MSAAAAADAPPSAKSKKKLVILIAVVALVLAGGGGAAVFMMKKKAAAEALEAGDGETSADASATNAGDATADAHGPAKAGAKRDPAAVPVFVPMDPFTVNLADRDAERYAQIGVTLEIIDAKTGDQIKNYMPAIRNNILMAIADRTAAELMGREGKTRLAEKIKRETARALGYEVGDDDAESGQAEDQPAKALKKKKKPAAAVLPIKAVHFSNFIIQ